VLNASGGGATQGILESLSALPLEDYKAYLVVPDQPNQRQRALFSTLSERYFQVPMTWWNRKVDLPLLWRLAVWARGLLLTWGHLRPVWQLCRIIRQYQIDIVYTSTAMIVDGALAAKICHVPHIWHIKEWVGQRARVKFWLSDRFLVHIISYLSNSVIVMTNFVGGIFREYMSGEKLHVIYDGVNLPAFQARLGGPSLREELGIQRDRFVVALSASLSSTWKQHDVFIEMASLLAARYPETIFVAFGSEPQKYKNPIYNRPWHYYQGLKRRVVEKGIEDRFFWAGFRQDIPRMMDAIDVLVHPCENEPFGRVAIEAMAAARPVIGPNRGGIAESVVDGQTGFLVQAGDAEAFARAVAILVENAALRQKIGENGCRHVATCFSLGQHVRRIEEVFMKTLGKKVCPVNNLAVGVISSSAKFEEVHKE
jgi:glycosyltransferase involved in cell wall biosynthesis